MKKKLIIAASIIILIMSASLLYFYNYLVSFGKEPLYLNENEQVFTLKRGTSIPNLIKQIEQQNLIHNAYLIPYLMKIKPELEEIKSGSYLLSPKMTVEQFLKLLISGKETQFVVQFIEGKRAKDWLATLSSINEIQHELKGLSSSQIEEKLGLTTSIEGLLYPDTYHYTADSTDLAILKRAQKKMEVALQNVWENRDPNLPYKTAYELLIMASIIEKETGVEDERAKVSSVFVNRLKLGMLLQTDPTVIYGMGDQYSGKIYSKNLHDKTNPYNTYIIQGLPPTPISMPSLTSLEAAAHPEKTNYLFFVADGHGGHIFNSNYKSHKKAVDNYWKMIKKGK